MSQLFFDTSAPGIDQLQQYLVKALGSIGVQCRFNIKQVSPCFSWGKTWNIPSSGNLAATT